MIHVLIQKVVAKKIITFIPNQYKLEGGSIKNEIKNF